jgi:hypothetical protein
MTAYRGNDGATLVVPTETDLSPGAVAAWVRAALGGLPEPAGLRAVLVTLDLVHGARARRAAPYVVRLTTLDRRRTLVVHVDDCTPAHAGCATDTSPVLAAALSSRWGVQQRRRGRTTWAELAIHTGDIHVGDIHVLAPDQPVPMVAEQRSRDRRTR